MPEAIEQAFIEVIADTSDFGEDLQRDVNRALRNVRRDATREFNRLEDIAAQTGGQIRAEIVQALQRISLGFEDVGGDARELALELHRLRPAFEELGDRGRAAFQQIEAQVERLDERIIAGPLNALRRTGEAADRFGQRFRAAMGRAAVGGPERLEEALEDVRRTGQQEFNLLEQSIRSSLGKLGNVPGLERLEEQFERMVEDIRVDFAAATANAEADLRQMANRGEISMEELEEDITRLAVRMDSQLSESIQEVHNKLRLVAGDEHIFDELAVSIDRAERETEQLQQALLEMERRAHNELAEEFERARLAASRLENEVEEVTAETRQATAATRRFGRQAQRSARRGTDAMGTFIARMNRIRFLALDLRFVLSGIGIFAAAQFARLGLEATSELEQVRLGFQVIGRNIEGDLGDSIGSFRNQAVASLDEVIEFARETPFAIGEVADAVRRLSAFLPSFRLFDPEQIDTLNERTAISIDLFRDMGGALAVLGQQEAMPRLVKALGDVAARGKLTGEEVRQLANAVPGIEIREAIITGIFDPTVQASESIQHLREEFSALGADATQAPQEALNAFVNFQKQGLITTDAVLQGLLVSFRQLAGEDAIQAFTLTLAGSMEKLRESIEVGMFRGLEPLGQTLVDDLLPALEDVENASTRFGESFADLAATSLPFLLDGFEVLTTVAANFFDQMSRFIAINGPEIDRFFESGAVLAETFFEALFALGEAIFPLVPLVFDLADVGLGALVPVLEAVVPLTESLAEGLGVLPPELIATMIALTQLNRVIRLLTLTSARVGFVNLGAAISTAHTAFSGFAKAVGGAAIGGILVASLARGALDRAFEAGQRAAEDFFDTVNDFSEVEPPEIAGALDEGITNARNRLEEFREIHQDMIDTGPETKSFFDIFHGAARGIANLGRLSTIVGNIQGATQEFERLSLASERLDQNLPELRDQLLRMRSGFDEAELGAALTDDALLNLLQSLDFTSDEIIELLNMPFGTFIGAVAGAVNEVGGLDTALRNAGITAGEFNLDKLAEEGATVEEVFLAAAGAVQELTDTMLASLDPNFAAIRARQDVVEAEQAVQDILASTDFESEADRRLALSSAYLDLNEAVAKEAAAEAELVGILAETGRGLDDNEEALGRLLQIYVDNPDIGKGALDAFIAENDITIERLRALARQFPELSGDINKFIAQLQNQSLRFGDAIEGMGLEMVGFKGQVRSAVDASIQQLGNMAPAVRAELTEMQAAAQRGGLGFRNRMYSIGFAGGTGLAAGLAAARGSVVSASAGLASGALVAAEGGFHVESPSKEFMRIGHMVGKGLQIGIEDSKSGVIEAINSITGFRPPTAPFAAIGASAAPPPGASSTSPGGFNMPISVTAPHPETAARRVVSEVSDVLYLNTGRSLS